MTRDFAFHAPGCLVGHANLSLNFSRGKRFRPCTDQEHQKVPNLQTHARTRKSCIGHRMDVMTAPLADVGWLFRQTMKASAPLAFWAAAGIAKSKSEQMIQTNVVCRESPGKLLEQVGVG